MKKAVAITLGVCLVSVLYLAFRSDSSSPDPSLKNPAKESAIEISSDLPAHASMGGLREKRAGTRVSKPTEGQVDGNRMTHRVGDFARGQLQNLQLGETLKMGNDPSFAPRLKPYRQFAIFVSPEEVSSEPFDSIIPQHAANIPEGTELTFEVRTRSSEDNWSEWTEVSGTDEPISVDHANVWQYRLTFFANDPATGPEVESVSIETRQASKPALSQHTPFSSANNSN